MVKVKTADLTGKALDWATSQVVQPKGFSFRVNDEYEPPEYILGMVKIPDDGYLRIIGINLPAWMEGLHEQWLDGIWSPSTDWAQGGPLIDEYCIWLSDDEGSFVASCEPHIGRYVVDGATSLIAICRALVLAKLGDEVDIPDELIEGANQ